MIRLNIRKGNLMATKRPNKAKIVRLSRPNRGKNSTEKMKSLQKLTLYFFDRPRATALIWLVVTIFGILSYTTLLKREGFPSINTPFAITQGTYLVNNPAKVDNDVSKPLNDFLLKQSGVKSVQSQSFDNFFTVIVTYEDSVKDADAKSAELQKKLDEAKILPEQAKAKIEAYKFGLTPRGDDLGISFYADKNNVPTEQLMAESQKAAEFIKSKKLSLVADVSIIDQFETATNPVTGQTERAQKSFDRYGERQNQQNNFYNSALIGVLAKDGADNLTLDEQIRAAVDELNRQPQFQDYTAVISASFAPQINAQINELQKVLLEGLIAVLIVGSVVIAVRASLITVVAMGTVIATTIGLLFLIGYSLNTITLFALILGLALIVDDTIIMIEAIDVQRKKRRDGREAVSVATRKVSRAMVAATSTAALSFAPLIFVGGILGSFIRAIPVTIISALAISLLVALIFIPLFARFLLLGKKQMGEENVHEIAAGVEERFARFISQPMLWAKKSRKKKLGVGLIAVLIGLGFIVASGFIFQKVTFNIFPADKDSNQLNVVLTYPPDINIEQAQATADKANDIVGDVTGADMVRASFFGQANIQSATLYIDLTDYSKRDIKAPEIVDKLDKSFEKFEGAEVKATQVSAGPPASPFTVRIDSSQNREASVKLADDIATYLKSTELKRIDGSAAKIESVAVGNSSIYNRKDSKPYVEVTATFVDDDTTTLVTLAQQAVEKEFPKSKVASYGIKEDALSFDFGQESENQDSFKTLAIAFPIVLLVIYMLLALQFRSLLQPLLIFMAIPFSLFGITLGLYLTDNAFSFFAMLGFFALLGLSIKNTILLTDFANQQRRLGASSLDAAHEALAERFRPLIATSLTAVFSLIPLVITSPFWEGLAIVLIGGLLSSTFLVVTVFPYYYLGAEFLRNRISRKEALSWIALSIGLAVVLMPVKLAPIAPIIAGLALYGFRRRRLARS